MNKKIILFLIFGIFLFSLAVSQPVFYKYYELDLSYNSGEFELNSIEIIFLNEIIKSYSGSEKAIVFDSKGEILNETVFNVPNKIFWESIDEKGNFNGSGFSSLDKINFYLYVPYYENAATLKIYNKDLVFVLDLDVSMFSKKEKIEEDLNLISEREKRQEFDNESNLSKKGKNSEKSFEENISPYWWAFLIVLIVLVFILIRDLTKKRNK